MLDDNHAFDDFFVATVLADLFDPENSEDLDLVSSKIVDGLSDLGLLPIVNERRGKEDIQEFPGQDSEGNISREDEKFAA